MCILFIYSLVGNIRVLIHKYCKCIYSCARTTVLFHSRLLKTLRSPQKP